MANTLTEDLGQLFERHREKFEGVYKGDTINLFTVAMDIVGALRYTGVLKKDEQ